MNSWSRNPGGQQETSVISVGIKIKYVKGSEMCVGSGRGFRWLVSTPERGEPVEPLGRDLIWWGRRGRVAGLETSRPARSGPHGPRQGLWTTCSEGGHRRGVIDQTCAVSSLGLMQLAWKVGGPESWER